MAQERNEEERSKFAKRVQGLPVQRLIFVDEMGINTNMSKPYGWAQLSERVVEVVPVNTPINTTVIGAISAKGMICAMSIPGAADGEAFARFVEKMLAPMIKPGQIVIMDNLATHKTARVEAAIKSVGGSIMYLPAYSPDLNPIEECWSKMKGILRGLAARTSGKLMEALSLSINSITNADIKAWIIHAGYHSSGKREVL